MKRQYYSLMLVAMFAFLLLGQSASAQSCSADFNAVIDGADVTFDGIATGVSRPMFGTLEMALMPTQKILNILMMLMAGIWYVFMFMEQTVVLLRNVIP